MSEQNEGRGITDQGEDTEIPDETHETADEHVSVQHIDNVICVTTSGANGTAHGGTAVNGTVQVDGTTGALHQAPTIVHHQEEVHLSHHPHHAQCLHPHHCLTGASTGGPQGHNCNGTGPVVTSTGNATLVSVVDHQGASEVDSATAHTLVDGTVPVSIPVQPVVSMPVNVSVPVLQDPNLSCTGDTQAEIQIKVDVEDGTVVSADDPLAQLAHHHHGSHGANVTTASIITIPVVPYTVIGDADGSGTTATAISVSLAQPETLAAHHQHQLQQHQLQSQQQLQNQQLQQEHVQHVQEVQVQQQQTQQPPPPVSNKVGQGQQSISQLTWEEAVSAPVLPVRCKDTNAELHKAKFGSGNKGKCIKAGNDWFTPTEFEALCGRGNSKDWKRSIRFGGRTLQTLIDKGFLVPHASSCICSNCVDDAAATGPIRPFTPYQRKRKNQQSNDHNKAKLERLTSKDSTTDESSEVGTPGTPLAGVNSLNPLAFLKMNQAVTTDDLWKNLEEMVEKLVTAAGMMKTMLQELKERTQQETESLRSQLQEQQELQNLQNLQTQQQQQQQQQQQAQHQITVGGIARNIIESPQILRIFDSNRIQTYSIEVLDPETFKQLQAAQATTAKIIYQDRRPGELVGPTEIKQEPGAPPLT